MGGVEGTKSRWQWKWSGRNKVQVAVEVVFNIVQVRSSKEKESIADERIGELMGRDESVIEKESRGEM